MKALILRAPEDLVIMNGPKPAPQPGQLLLRVRQCGICGLTLGFCARRHDL